MNHPQPPNPTKGRVVNYVGTDGVIYAALVTDLEEVRKLGTVCLVSFGRSSFYFCQGVEYANPADNNQELWPNTWHWPVRG